MKRFQTLMLMIAMISCTAVVGQTQKPKQSPPASVSETIRSGAKLSIDYGQPSLRGRVIGESVEPMKDKVWRMGANEATVFSTDKDIKINGQSLPAGKYSMFGLVTDEGFTVIFNKDWKIWGTEYEQHKANDLLKVTVIPFDSPTSYEKLTYTIAKDGTVSGYWGTSGISFKVE